MKYILFCLLLLLCNCTKKDREQKFLLQPINEGTEFTISLPQNSAGKKFVFELTSIDNSKKANPPQTLGLGPSIFLKILSLTAISDFIKLTSDIAVTGKTVYLAGYEDVNNNGKWELNERSFGKIMNPIEINNYYKVGYNPEWMETEKLQMSFCNEAKASVKCSIYFDSEAKIYLGETITQNGIAEIYLPKNLTLYGSCESNHNGEKYYASIKSKDNLAPEICRKDLVNEQILPISKSDFKDGLYITWWKRKWGEKDNQNIKQKCIDNVKIVSYIITPLSCKNTNTICSVFDPDQTTSITNNFLGKFLQKSSSISYPITMNLRENSKVKGTCFVDANFFRDMQEEKYDDCAGLNIEPSFYWKSHTSGNIAIPDEVDISSGGSLSPVPSWYDPKLFCN